MHIPGGQLTQFQGADRCQDRCQDVLVLLDGLGGPPAESFAQPVFGCAADRVALTGLEAGFEFLVELLQPVLDDGLGPAGDPGPDPFRVGAVPEADRAPPPPLAVPVPLAITAGGVVIELILLTPKIKRARLSVVGGQNHYRDHLQLEQH